MPMSAALRILLVDDHPVVRQGLRYMLESDPEVVIVGEAGDGPEGIRLAAEQQPDIVVMDVSLPGMNGIEATREITRLAPGVKVLVVSMHADAAYVRQGVKAGARGYVLKDSEDLDLLHAVRVIATGQTFFSPAVAGAITGSGGGPGEAGAYDDETRLDSLTRREREVLRLIADGLTNKEIAARLSLSINTIETHRKHLMEKLACHNAAELVRFSVRVKLVE
jgi:two-component system response regulator NreC